MYNGVCKLATVVQFVWVVNKSVIRHGVCSKDVSIPDPLGSNDITEAHSTEATSQKKSDYKCYLPQKDWMPRSHTAWRRSLIGHCTI